MDKRPNISLPMRINNIRNMRSYVKRLLTSIEAYEGGLMTWESPDKRFHEKRENMLGSLESTKHILSDIEKVIKNESDFFNNL